jgi:hypothetical protein
VPEAIAFENKNLHLFYGKKKYFEKLALKYSAFGKLPQRKTIH